MKNTNKHIDFIKDLSKRILVLDGALGTMIQRLGLSESDFRGDIFKSQSINLVGNNDILSLTNPKKIESIHLQYLESGADIIETNTFNANEISQKEYGTESYCFEFNKQSALIANNARKIFYKKSDKNNKKYIAGSIGPSNISLSLNDDINFDSFANAYITQIEGLIEGGVDLLLVETVYDTLSCKAILYAIQEVFINKNTQLPIIVSATINEYGRNLIGQTLEEFYYAISDYDNIAALGINCSFGIEAMSTHINRLSQISEIPISVYANAGLPDDDGKYHDTPEFMASAVKKTLTTARIGIIGGCCGTTPEHIKSISEIVFSTGKVEEQTNSISPRNTVYVSEKTNISGSKAFKDAFIKSDFSKAVDIASRQIELGADIIDLNLDSGLIDSKNALKRFIEAAKSDYILSDTRYIIDSIDLETIELALKLIPGKVIVNSISLEQGEAEFIKKAESFKKYGASVIILAADENGLATDYQRKTEICKRAYNILTKKVGLKPECIIFDTLILPIATGIDEHNSYARDVINSIKWIKRELTGCKTIIGVSNVSFSFRGNRLLRAYINKTFLDLLIESGLDYAILNPEDLKLATNIESYLYQSIEKVLLNLVSKPTDMLISISEKVRVDVSRGKLTDSKSDDISLVSALIQSKSEDIKQKINRLLEKGQKPLEIIDQKLMPALAEIGDKYNKGVVFLPQVLKAATEFNRAIDILKPFMNEEDSHNTKAKVLLATVRGDVHDIGKYIISTVLKCNAYDVIDLGVKVDNKKIVESAIAEQVDFVAVSGLISPSLKEMENLAAMMQEYKLEIPLIVGGAATSLEHTAKNIATKYSNLVLYVNNPVELINVLSDMKDDILFKEKLDSKYKSIIEKSRFTQKSPDIYNREEVKTKHEAVKPKEIGVNYIYSYNLNKIADNLNWNYFLSKWNLKSGSLNKQVKEDLLNDAKKTLKFIIDKNIFQANAAYGIFKAERSENSIRIYHNDIKICIDTPRQKSRSDGHACLALSDFINKEDYIGLFSVTTGIGLNKYTEYLELKKKDAYQSLLIKILADTLVESFADILHKQIILEKWDTNKEYIRNNFGIRPAFGYSMLPNHSQKRLIFDILQPEKIGISLTDTFAMEPASSICGMIINNPNARYFNVK